MRIQQSFEAKLVRDDVLHQGLVEVTGDEDPGSGLELHVKAIGSATDAGQAMVGTRSAGRCCNPAGRYCWSHGLRVCMIKRFLFALMRLWVRFLFALMRLWVCGVLPA